MDGLDGVLVDFAGARPRLLKHLDAPLPQALKNELVRLCSPSYNELHRLATADREFAEVSAELVLRLLQEAKVSASQVTAIGSHGQTVRHMPDALTPYTLQLGDANTLAALTGIAVVADFRRKDIALGGQGAPLVPAFHDALFRQQLPTGTTAAVLNLGGIANVTVIGPKQQVAGFDTGPANTLLDLWYQLQHPESPYAYDKEGAYAAQGQVIAPLLAAMMEDAYVLQQPPKSTGREYFNYAWLERHLDQLPSWRAADVQATLTEYTAQSVAYGLTHFCSNAITQVFVAGGGAFNAQLMQRLATNYPTAQWQSVAELGVDPQHLEAMAFAWLARQFMLRKPGNLPAVTGASRATVLGGLFLP